METLNTAVCTNSSQSIQRRKSGNVHIVDSYVDMPENCVTFDKFENEFFLQLKKRYGKL